MLRARCDHVMNQWWIRWCPSLALILKLIYNESDCEVFTILIVTLNITFDHFIVDQIFIQLNKFNSLTLGYFTVIIKCDNCDEWIITQMVYSKAEFWEISRFLFLSLNCHFWGENNKNYNKGDFSDF